MSARGQHRPPLRPVQQTTTSTKLPSRARLAGRPARPSHRLRPRPDRADIQTHGTPPEHSPAPCKSRAF
eukprot:3341080-Lingulodinium_polyedra.AAC.1